MKEDRDAALKEILTDPAPHKVIVAGPGTGKSYTFERVIEGVEGEVLALTFLNNLVHGLQADLGQSADVRTFHSFSRKLLHEHGAAGVSTGVDYYPGFEGIAAADATLIGTPTDTRSLTAALMNMDEASHQLATVLRVGNYYDAVGHNDSVYRVNRHLEANPELIPAYAYVLVDEYQDFSRLEVNLLDKLWRTSPGLVVGDDDQSLYEELRHARPQLIRDLVAAGQFKQFSLPYCSRCTKVMVDAVHTVVDRAQKRGLLAERIEKPFRCYLPDKESDSKRYPKLIHAHCTVDSKKAPYIGRYIADEIIRTSDADIGASREKGHPTVLILGPKQFIRRIDQVLRERFRDVEYRSSPAFQVSPQDAYARILRDEQSRLGWRLILELHQPEGWQDWVRNAIDEEVELFDLLQDGFRSRHLAAVDVMRSLRADEAVTDEAVELACDVSGLTEDELYEWLVGAQDTEDEEDVEESDEELGQEPNILITSLVGAKGLQAEHCFVVGVDAMNFPSRGILTDNEVCKLLVVLTRARKSCTFVTCGRFGGKKTKGSVFINWLKPHLESRRVDRDYMRAISDPS